MTRFSSFGIILVALLTLMERAPASTTTNLVTEDSWIVGLGSTTPQGAGTDLRICPVANYWIYLKFDLSGLSGFVTDAELRLNRFGGSRPEEISVYLITDDSWTEAALTGVNRPAPISPPNATALGTGVAAGPYDAWNSQALTDAVAQEAAGDGIVTLMVREDPAGAVDVRNYYSKEAPQPDNVKPRLVVTTAVELIDSQWLVADVGPGVKPALDFDTAGRIHVMGMTETGGGLVWHDDADAMFGPWSPQTISTGYFYGPGDIRVDSDGTAHMAWHNHDLPGPRHVVVPPGGPVQTFDISHPGQHDGWDNALAFSPSGTLHQSSVYPSAFGATDSLQFGTFNGTNWTYAASVAGSGPFMYGLATSLAMDQSGNPHIAFCASTDWTTPGDLVYACQTSGVWQFSAVVTGGIRGRFPSLALDHWDRPHITWIDIDSVDHTLGTVRYGVLEMTGWVIDDIDTLTNMNLSFGGARKSTSLVLDSNWRPHVAYADQQIVKYAHKPFATWNVTSVLQHASPINRGLVELELDNTSRPGIVFWQSGPPSPGLVRLARPRQTEYTFSDVSPSAAAGDILIDWSPGFDGHQYTVQMRNPVSGVWSNASGAWPVSTTTWTSQTVSASHEIYRILASPL